MWNSSIFQQTSIFQYDIGRIEKKSKFFFSKFPADRLKRCIMDLEDYENPSVLKYIFSLPRYIDSSISAGLKSKISEFQIFAIN